MLINVSQTDIKKGRKEDSKSCAIALALKRTFGSRVKVDVQPYAVNINKTEYSLPVSARDFVRDFDQLAKREVKPFSFEL
jgi:hypothetical protein